MEEDDDMSRKINVCKQLGGKPKNTGTFECEGVDKEMFEGVMKKEKDAKK